MDQDLEKVQDSLPIDETIAFVDKRGEFNEGVKKRQLKILKPVAAILKPVLEQGEKIVFTAPGCSPMTFLEAYTTGWMIYSLKACVLVFTNKRIIHIPLKSGKPKNSIAQVKYGDIKEYKVKGILSGYLNLVYKSGKKENFQQIKASKKKLKSIIEMFISSAEVSPVLERQHMCPKCLKPVEKKKYTCSKCGLVFKNPDKARFYSIVYPGGGYFYVGNTFFGIIDALAEVYISVLLLIFIVALFGNTESEYLSGIISVIIIFGILVAEKLFSVYHANHYVEEYIPAKKGDINTDSNE